MYLISICMMKITPTHISSAYEVYHTSRSANDHVGALADLTSLVAGRHPAVDNHRADYGVERELVGFVVDLRHKLACRTNNDGLRLLNHGECAAFDAVA